MSDHIEEAITTIRAAGYGAIDAALVLVECLRSQNVALSEAITLAVDTIEILQRPDVDPFSTPILDSLAALRQALEDPPIVVHEPLTIAAPFLRMVRRPQ